MVLNPLAEVRVRMLVSIRVGCRQLVMDVLGHSEGRKADEDANKAQNAAVSEEGQEGCPERSWHHRKNKGLSERSLRRDESQPKISRSVSSCQRSGLSAHSSLNYPRFMRLLGASTNE